MTIRRLSDEEPDPLENDDVVDEHSSTTPWALWGPDVLNDIYTIVSERLTPQQREIIEAYLTGYNYHDLLVTEKYWRYHFARAIKRIQKELGL
jgi:hypothetical protein